MTAGPPAEEQPAPRRRRHRRATGGVPAPAGETPSRPDAAEPLLPTRGADDEDTGWGETPGGAGGNDERLLRDVPPHW